MPRGEEFPVKCQNCGIENTEGKLFCDICGASLKRAPASVTQAPAAARSAPGETEIESRTLDRLVTKLRQKPLLGGVPLAIVIVIALFFTLRGNENAVQPPSESVPVSAPVPVPAMEINVRNDYDKLFYLAFVYYDDDEAAWTTRGWYDVPEGKTRNIKFPTSRTEFFMHGEFEDGTPLLKNAGALTRTVIDNSFRYRDGEECPEGSGMKTVQFVLYTAREKDYKDGTYVLDLSMRP
jgi:hypothetical protein